MFAVVRATILDVLNYLKRKVKMTYRIFTAQKKPERIIGPKVLADHYAKLAYKCDVQASKEIGFPRIYFAEAADRFRELSELYFEEDSKTIEV